MFKKAAGLLGVLASLAVAAPAQAQWNTFTPDNAGPEFWDNRSTDGEKCNIGYVLTGVATAIDCNNQRPAGWLPYSGPAMTEYWAFNTFVFGEGSLTYNVGTGTGGDIAGLNLDWGFWELVAGNKVYTNLNTVASTTSYNFGAGSQWGFWVETGGNTLTSDVNGQFAMFRGAGDSRIIGIEDVVGGDYDYQDMIASVNITQVPEPTSLALLAVGSLAAIGAVRRRRA